MYDDFFIVRDDGCGLELACKHDPVNFNVGDHHRRLEQHRRSVQEAFEKDGLRGLRAHDRVLMRRIADTRTFRCACELLLGERGKAPGPNGLSLEDLNSPEMWSMCRTLAQAVRDGAYKLGKTKMARIPKPGKLGQFRSITLQTVEDRVVAKGTGLILQPITELHASPFSFGYRPGRNRMHALATALALARRDKRWVWVKADVEKAFDRVPVGRLTSVLRKYFPEDVVSFLRKISNTGRKQGIFQGSPLSPLLFNLYADHTLGQPWQLNFPNDILIRYADDLLIPCLTETDAEQRLAELSRLTISAGIPLKKENDSAISNIEAGQSLTWLGYSVRREANRLTIRISDRAWDQLDLGFAKTHLQPASPLRAIEVVLGWIAQLGPCYQFEDPKAVFTHIRAVAAAQAFDELPSDEILSEQWRSAETDWLEIYSRQNAIVKNAVDGSRLQFNPNSLGVAPSCMGF
jgi:hypothetical protein